MIIPKNLRDTYLKKAEAELFDKENTQKYWDPATEIPNMNELSDENKQIKAQQIYVEENIEQIRKKQKIKAIITTSLVLIVIITLFLNPTPTSSVITIISLLFAIIISQVIKTPNIRKITVDIIKLEVAKRNNYLYSPKENTQRFQKYLQKYPDAFRRGTQEQNIEDVFWGVAKRNNKEHQFTTGLYNYAQYEGSGKNRRLVRYTDHYFAIRLNKKINTSFSLIPNQTFLGNIFSGRKITTESKKFNDTYKIINKNKNEHSEIEIIKTLTPRVQEELLNLKEKYNTHKNKKIFYGTRHKANGITIILEDETILFYIPGPLIPHVKTKFKKNMKILDEDIHAVNEELNNLIDITTEITKYIK